MDAWVNAPYVEPCFYCSCRGAPVEASAFYYVYGRNWGSGPVGVELVKATFRVCRGGEGLYRVGRSFFPEGFTLPSPLEKCSNPTDSLKAALSTRLCGH